MKLDRVTVTGADDATDREGMLALSLEFPFVEWGILVSAKQHGTSRFPSREWLDDFRIFAMGIEEEAFRLSMHVCGRWVREIYAGLWSNFLGDLLPNGRGYSLFERFQRVQLNTHAEPHEVSGQHFALGAKAMASGHQIIVQMDGVNDHAFGILRGERGNDVAALFDLSHGAGLLPERWNKRIDGEYCGYAGGLSPENVDEQLRRISTDIDGDMPCPPSVVWIDAETHLRCGYSGAFDLGRVRRFLEACAPWVRKPGVRSTYDM